MMLQPASAVHMRLVGLFVGKSPKEWVCLARRGFPKNQPSGLEWSKWPLAHCDAFDMSIQRIACDFVSLQVEGVPRRLGVKKTSLT
jgi:hypothetical protein